MSLHSPPRVLMAAADSPKSPLLSSAHPLMASAVSQVQGAPEALPNVADLSVISVHDSQPVLLTSLWSSPQYQRTIVVLLRHWL